MTSSVLYCGALRTECTHLHSGSQMETDAPTDNNGRGERFSPTDLLATSLASCMLTVMGIKARSLGYDLDGLKVDVAKKMKADPRRVGGIELTYTVPENLQSLSGRDVAVLKAVALNCPVQKSIHPDIEVTVNWGAWEQQEVPA